MQTGVLSLKDYRGLGIYHGSVPKEAIRGVVLLIVPTAILP